MNLWEKSMHTFGHSQPPFTGVQGAEQDENQNNDEKGGSGAKEVDAGNGPHWPWYSFPLSHTGSCKPSTSSPCPTAP